MSSVRLRRFGAGGLYEEFWIEDITTTTSPRKGKIEKLKICFFVLLPKIVLFCFDTRQKVGRRESGRSQEKRKKFLIAGAAVASRRSEV